ncbi:MAG: serine/threonine protein kinase [Fimbriiglobus sp.]
MRLPSLSGRTPKPTSDSGGYARVQNTPIPPSKAFIGKVFLGKYETIRFLGEGSNAHVFLAREVSDHSKLVVVKRIKDHVQQTPRFRQFFEGEVRSMSKFHHPYAVRLHGASLDDPHGACLVLDFIPGVTLEAILTKHRTLDPIRMGQLLGPLLHALYAAGKTQLVHRDLKPANLMVMNYLTDLETVRVMDFGFAGFSSKPHIQLAELTGQGSVFACGTPAYVSPEMVRGDAVDARGDLYSVGVMMFEMLTGRLPFECQSMEDLMAAHISEPPPRFHRIGFGHIPPAVEGVVQIALSKFPSERHPNAKELAIQLGRALGFDLWTASEPPQEKIASFEDDDEIVLCTIADTEKAPPSPADKFVLSDMFEALLPEKLAVVKLRGFIEDVGGMAVASEPGFIRVQLELPPNWKEPTGEPTPSKSGLFSMFSANRMPSVSKGKEPIEVDLKLHKINADRVSVLVAFRPLKWYLPDDQAVWNSRCEQYYTTLRNYLMGS